MLLDTLCSLYLYFLWRFLSIEIMKYLSLFKPPLNIYDRPSISCKVSQDNFTNGWFWRYIHFILYLTFSRCRSKHRNTWVWRACSSLMWGNIVVNCKEIPIRHKTCLIIIKLKPVMRTIKSFTSLRWIWEIPSTQMQTLSGGYCCYAFCDQNNPLEHTKY